MRNALKYYYKNPFTGICVLFAAIPFWVPLAAILFTGADGMMMFMTSILVFAARAAAKASLTHKNPFLSVTSAFMLSPLVTLGKLIIFFIVTGFLMTYGYAGAHIDSSLAAIGIILLFNFMFIRSATGFGFINTLLFFLGIILWIAFLSGFGGFCAALAYAVNMWLFHRRYGAAIWS